MAKLQKSGSRHAYLQNTRENMLKANLVRFQKGLRENVEEQHQKNKDIIATPAQIPKSALTAVDGHNNDGVEMTVDLYNDNPIKQGPNKQVANQHTTF